MSILHDPIPFDETVPGVRDDAASWDEPEYATDSVLLNLEGPPRIGRYVFLDRIGEGGMGVVVAAFDPKLDRKVAIKLIHKVTSDDTERRMRMEREAQAMARLSHPNVVTVYEVGEYAGQLFVAMEFINGRDLQGWVRAQTEPDWRDTLDILIQAGRGLAAAHRAGLVHRDFKPNNVFVGRDRRARVGDFGLALHESDGTDAQATRKLAQVSHNNLFVHTLTQTGAAIGTPAYMAPEQFLVQTVDAASDQFAFCVTAWEAIYGERPFGGSSYAELMAAVTDGKIADPPADSQVPEWLCRILRRGLSVAKTERFSSMDELLAELQSDPETQRHSLLKQVAGLIGLVVVASVVTWLVAAAQERAAEAEAQSEAELERTAGELAELRELVSDAQKTELSLRDNRRMSAARRYGARDTFDPLEDPAIVAAVLREVEDPSAIAGWSWAAANVLEQPMRRFSSEYPGTLSHVVADSEGRVAAVAGEREIRITSYAEPGFYKKVHTQKIPLTDKVRAMALAPKGNVLAVALAETNVVGLWKLDGRGRVSGSLELSGSATQLNFGPDGTQIMGADAVGGVSVWDVEDGTLMVEAPRATCGCYLTRQLLATGHHDGHVKVWDLKTGVFANMMRHGEPVIRIACDTPTQQVASFAGKRVKVRGQDGQVVTTQRGEVIDEIHWVKGGELLLTLERNGRLMVAAPGQRRGVVLQEPSTAFRQHKVALAVSDDGSRIALAGAANLRVWDAYELGEPRDLAGQQPAVGITFASTQSLLSIANTGQFDGWYLPSTKTRTFQIDQRERVHGWIGGGKLLTSLGEDNRLRDALSGTVTILPPLPRVDELSELAIEITGPIAGSVDGKLIVAGLNHGRLGLWHTGVHPRAEFLGAEPATDTTALAVSPDNSMILQGTIDGNVRVWSAVSGTLARHSRRHAHAITSIVALPGDSAVSASEDGVLYSWRGDVAEQIGKTSARLYELNYDRDHRRLVAKSRDGHTAYRIAIHERGPGDYRIGPRTSTVIAVPPDDATQVSPIPHDVWDWVRGEDNKPLSPVPVAYRGHMRFDHASQLIADAQDSGVVSIREVGTGRLVVTLPGGARPVDLFWSPDGQRVAVVDERGVVSIHRLPSREDPKILQDRLERATHHCLSVELRVRELGEDFNQARRRARACQE